MYLLVQKGFSFFLFVWLVVFAHLLLSVYTQETNTVIIKAYYYKPHCRNTTQYTVAHLFFFFFLWISFLMQTLPVTLEIIALERSVLDL